MSSHSQLRVLDKSPLNADPPDVAVLIQHPLTPSELMYCRNHCDIPVMDESQFSIKIDGMVQREMLISLADIKANHQPQSIVAALQCAGNRRQKMVDRTSQDVEGIKWGEATICNVKWTGVLLRDLLDQAGVISGERRVDTLHVCFASHAATCQEDENYSVSIPLSKVMDPRGDVLLAYQMNDCTLTPEHGHPLRVVVPGYSGVRWVKWVDRITIAAKESQDFYQQKDYKILPVTVDSHDKADSEGWWTKIPALQANPLNSVVASIDIMNPPKDELHCDVLVKGYALSGAAGQVKKVEVSVDQGQKWITANINYQEGRHSWTLWEATTQAPIQGNKVTAWSRATDESGEQQTPSCDWNLRGVAYCAVGEKTVDL